MRRLMVCLKRVVDYNVRVRVRPDGSGVATEGVKMSINPFDEIALEEALRIKERGAADEVLVVSLEPLTRARVLLAIARKEEPFLVLLGKQAIDDDNNQTGQMLAALWGRPQATFASKLRLDDGVATVTREVDEGLETIEIDLPGVVTTDLRLNEPRYVKLPEILKAKRKPLEVLELATMGIPAARQFEHVRTEAPPPRRKGMIVDDVAGLVGELKRRGLA